MAKDKLSTFIDDNQAILTCIALFSGLAAFFFNFFQDKDNDAIVNNFLPFISILIVVFLVIHLYLKLEVLNKIDKPLFLFKILMLVFLSFIVLFVWEYQAGWLSMLGKLVLLLFFLLVFLKLFKFSKERRWLLNTHYFVGTLLVYLILVLAPSLMIASSGCITNEYSYFILFSIMFSSTLYILTLIIYTYNNIFDKVVKVKEDIKRGKLKLKKLIFAMIITILTVALVNYVVRNFFPAEIISDLLVWLITLPKTLFCS